MSNISIKMRGVAKAGFTLLELAVVIIIIALIAGSITVGTDLIRSAKLKTITDDAQKYIKAVQLFKDKYHSLPGDMPDATLLWGAADAVPADCRTTETPNTDDTCDGNGDGYINSTGTTADDYEAFRAWQHLANANLLEGSFTGAGANSNVSEAEIGTNSPQAALGGTFAFNSIQSAPASNTILYERSYGNFLMFGPLDGSGSLLNYWGIISAQEAKNIDKKFDDDHPVRGNIAVTERPATNQGRCTTSGDPATADYLLSDPRKDACALIFIF